jgi:hypothetical protein
MNIIYRLKICTNEINQLNTILGLSSTILKMYWTFDYTQHDYSNYFKKIIHPNINLIRKYLYGDHPISVWILYEYEDQCNIELLPSDIKNLASFDAVLCISCWESDSMSEL